MNNEGQEGRGREGSRGWEGNVAPFIVVIQRNRSFRTRERERERENVSRGQMESVTMELFTDNVVILNIFHAHGAQKKNPQKTTHTLNLFSKTFPVITFMIQCLRAGQKLAHQI